MTMALVARRRYQDVGIGSRSNDAIIRTLRTYTAFPLRPFTHPRDTERRDVEVNQRNQRSEGNSEVRRGGPVPPLGAIIASTGSCTGGMVLVDRVGMRDGKSRGAGDMAVTARNAWNVARHAAPAQSHGAIHRPFGPLPIRFRCPSSFCRGHRRKQRIRLCPSELK